MSPAGVALIDHPSADKVLFDTGYHVLLYLVNLPGHAAGQIGLPVRLHNGFIFFLADACWLIDNLRDGINQHGLANILCDDRRAYIDTLNKLRRCYQQAAELVGKADYAAPSA